MKIFKYIGFLLFITLIISCTSQPIDTINEKIIKVEVNKTCSIFDCKSSATIYTKNKMYYYNNITNEGISINMSGPTYVYKSFDTVFFRTEKLK